MSNIAHIGPGRAVARFALLLHHIALELRILRNNHPDMSAIIIADEIATVNELAAADIREHFAAIKTFVQEFDEAVNSHDKASK